MYFMRFFITDAGPLTLDLLEAGLKAVDSEYAITDRGTSSNEYGVLTYQGDVYGEIDLNTPGDDLFGEELAEFRETVTDGEGSGKDLVLKTLDETKLIVAVRVLWQDRESEETLGKIDPLWEWLSKNRIGLLQADGEGFYDGGKLILKLP